MSGEDPYLIWSHEHAAWWMRGGRYTKSLTEAGRFSRDRALLTCLNAMLGTADRLGALPELPVRLADVQKVIDTYRGKYPTAPQGVWS